MFLQVPINSYIIEEHDQKHIQIKTKGLPDICNREKGLDTITQH